MNEQTKRPAAFMVSLTRCYDCQFGEHRDPPTPHTWGSPDDFAHMEATGQQPPDNCGCECANPTPKITVRADRTRIPVFGGRVWRWLCPECDTGSSLDWAKTLTAAIRHRWSRDCRYRRDDADGDE